MTLNSIYLVLETWCTIMNSYKHLVHLKSTTRKQSVLSFVYNFGVYIWIFWCRGETRSVSLIKLPHMTKVTVTDVICSLQVWFLAQKRCHTLGLLNQVSRKQENTADTMKKVHEGDSRDPCQCTAGKATMR